MPSATPPAVRERALALLAGGMSTRAVQDRLRAEGTPLGKSTIAELDKARRTGSAKGQAPKAAVVARPSPCEESSPRSQAVEPPSTEPPLDEVSLEELVDGASARDVRQLERTSALFTKRIEEALAERDTKTLATLTPLRLQIGTALARLRPPARLDPEADPANIAARDELRARIERLALGAESGEVTRAAMRAHLDRIEARASLPPEERAP